MAQVGSLRGRVTSAEGEALVGATVIVIGTYKGANTDSRGNFNIEGIKTGDYSIKFSYIGFADKVYNGVRITTGGTQTLNAQLSPVEATLGEVEIVGKKALIDLESGQSTVEIGAKDLGEMAVVDIQDVAAMQVGVSQNADGIQIRGSRVYETEYVVDGISAQDPLAGTGFGVDVNVAAVQNVNITTGGTDVEYGNGSAGVVATTLREGGSQFNVNLDYRSDNFGVEFEDRPEWSWNSDEITASIGGPIIKDKLTFFTSAFGGFSDAYYGPTADQLRSSLFSNDSLWAPRQANSWTHIAKIAFRPRLGLKFSISNTHSLNINQNSRTLQVVGNDAILTPGFQFPFSLDLDNATTYTHHSNLTVFNMTTLLGPQWTLILSLGRLSTNLRADANGRPFREETVDRIYDAASIVTDPVTVFNPNSPIGFVFPGPGLVNNGGLAARWHDHYVYEYTIKPKFTFESENRVHYVSLGFEHKEQEYSWIDVTSPWVGAPIQINDSVSTPSTRLGSTSDFWQVKPANGGIFVSDQIEYKGIVANLGLRLNYWAPGKYLDERVADSLSPIPDGIRQDYQDETFALLGRRWKARLLPRIRVSFPITENNVLYFNYSHTMRQAFAQFMYEGLDPVFQDRSVLSQLGNPNINPEVSVSYEVGLKSQLTKDLALSVTAFYTDKFDYIVRRRVEVAGPTGAITARRISINQDYARIRGIEVSFIRRIGDWFSGTVSGAYQIATGKSNTAAESSIQIVNQGFVNTTKEQFLAWDRPLDFKLNLIFTPDNSINIGSFPLKGFRAALSGTWKSGLRYTPHTLAQVNDFTGRPEYEPIITDPFGAVGSAWFWMDFRLSRDFFFGKRQRVSISLEIDNLTNYRSTNIINPVTGTAWEFGDPLPLSARDPNYPDPQDNGTPPDNPARYTAPRHIWLGLQYQF